MGTMQIQVYNQYTCLHFPSNCIHQHFCGSNFSATNINLSLKISSTTQFPSITNPPHKLNRDHVFSMATSISATGLGSSLHGSWSSSICGDDYAMLVKSSVPSTSVRVVQKPFRFQPLMKNVNEGKGVFAPIVVVTRNIVGKKRFNQLRGKAIALHSQVITEFCKSIGADAKQRQGLIRLAKKNGERLGFLA